MKGFARVTKLTNIKGRGDYISNPARQEEILAKSEPVDWTPYHQFEQENRKTSTRNNEGREVMVALPNDWAKLSPAELQNRAAAIAKTAAGKETDLQWAVHWNKSRSNLHLHVIFSERQKEKNPGRWDRDVYLTSEGKVARRKADRAKDKDGNILPPVHRKGELKGSFTAKDPRYTARSWVPQVKSDLQSLMSSRWNVRFEPPEALHEYHEGKGREAAAIRQKNTAIRETNAAISVWHDRFPRIDLEKIKPHMVAAVKKGQVFVLLPGKDGKMNMGAISIPDWLKIKPQYERILHSHGKDLRQEPASGDTQPFTALLAAQREYYRRAFAIYDNRKPIDPAVLSAPAKCREALQNLQADHDACNDIRQEMAGYRFWQGKQKKEAAQRYTAASRRCDHALAALEGFGVSIWVSQRKVSGNPLPDEMQEIERRADVKIRELQDKADMEKRFERPADALNPSQSALEAARGVFEAGIGRIPPDQRKAAREALEAAKRGFAHQGNPSAHLKAIERVQTVEKSLLPEQRHDRTRKKSRNHER